MLVVDQLLEQELQLEGEALDLPFELSQQGPVLHPAPDRVLDLADALHQAVRQRHDRTADVPFGSSLRFGPPDFGKPFPQRLLLPHHVPHHQPEVVGIVGGEEPGGSPHQLGAAPGDLEGGDQGRHVPLGDLALPGADDPHQPQGENDGPDGQGDAAPQDQGDLAADAETPSGRFPETVAEGAGEPRQDAFEGRFEALLGDVHLASRATGAKPPPRIMVRKTRSDPWLSPGP